jgi:DNA polymerase V
MIPSPESLIALVDGNNFFCSCERVFDPKLLHVPLLVLSNNDGCVISRSQEVKDLGIAMGVPFFKIRDLVTKHRIQIRSTNFPLYNDMSFRLMQTLGRWATRSEVYSIDESFLSVPSLQDPFTWATNLRKAVLQEIGIPVSIGVAPTKVLAKLSNRIAKKTPSSGGVWIWNSKTENKTLLQSLECGDVWGIGRERSLFLKQNGIETVWDFIQAERAWVRQHMTVSGERLWMELRGTPALDFDENPAPQKSVLCSRSFGRPVTSLDELREAISSHLFSGCEKLRFQKSVAGTVHVFIRGDRWKSESLPLRSHASHRLSRPTDFTPTLIQIGLKLVEELFDSTARYKKAGILLTDLQDRHEQQLCWFEESIPEEKQQSLMKTMDRINQRWGSEKITIASSGITKAWSGKSSQRSPNYTRSWRDLPVAK